MQFLKKFFGQMFAVSGLAKSAMVSQHVPATAEYVTIGPVTLMTDAEAFNGGPAGYESPDKLFGRGNHRDYGYIPAEYGDQQICYLVLANDQLLAISPGHDTISFDASQVYALDARSRSGFILFNRDGRGLAVGAQTPVQIPASHSFKTLSGVTNGMYGWDKALEKYGIKATW